ncbi:MAG: glutathione S-transferase family protein [Pseudomonadales bacterium]|nr:glutathione S-transferase family protein [Pseudomonadales bacterium]MDA0761050.1 glutathione S-transferase family protein [Pseudomonadota bacterium]MDA1206785.1 glutathione S-transferase family protein [Pseudomonadota bacterium]
MTTLTLYGTAGSRAFRSLWAAKDMQLDFNHVPTNFRGDNQSPEYLAVNPNGRIPAMVDGDLVLFESMAINLYLAKRYAAEIMPTTYEAEARATQWSIWGISEIEPLQMQIVIQQFFTPKDLRDGEVINKATLALQRPLLVLNQVLENSPYLLGEDFTIADLNVAGVMDLLTSLKFDFSDHPAVQQWLGRCQARPSYTQTKAMANSQGA